MTKTILSPEKLEHLRAVKSQESKAGYSLLIDTQQFHYLRTLGFLWLPGEGKPWQITFGGEGFLRRLARAKDKVETLRCLVFEAIQSALDSSETLLDDDVREVFCAELRELESSLNENGEDWKDRGCFHDPAVSPQDKRFLVGMMAAADRSALEARTLAWLGYVCRERGLGWDTFSLLRNARILAYVQAQPGVSRDALHTLPDMQLLSEGIDDLLGADLIRSEKKSYKMGDRFWAIEKITRRSLEP